MERVVEYEADQQLGEKHKLDFINILNDNGTLNHNVGSGFEGMKRFDARYEVISKLKEKGLYVKWENNPMRVPLCEKSKDIIEPIIKPQVSTHVPRTWPASCCSTDTVAVVDEDAGDGRHGH